MQDGQRPAERAGDAYLVGDLARGDAREQPGTGRAVGTQDVGHEAVQRKIRPRGNETGGVGPRLIGADAGAEADVQHRIGQERLGHLSGRGHRGSAENEESGRPGQARRRFDRNVPAQAPADDHRVVRVQRPGEPGQRGRVAGQGVGRRIDGPGGQPVPGQAERQAPETLPERAGQQRLPGPGGTGIAVHEDDGALAAHALQVGDLLTATLTVFSYTCRPPAEARDHHLMGGGVRPNLPPRRGLLSLITWRLAGEDGVRARRGRRARRA